MIVVGKRKLGSVHVVIINPVQFAILCYWELTESDCQSIKHMLLNIPLYQSFVKDSYVTMQIYS